MQQYALPPSEPGGTRQFELAQVFIERGWSPRILASDFTHLEKRNFRRSSPQDRSTMTVVEDGVPFTYLWVPPYERNNWRRTMSMGWFSIRAFGKVLRSSETVVYGSSPHIFGAFAAHVAARIRRRPFVFEVRDLWPEHLAAVDPSIENSLLYRFVGVLATHLYRKSALVVIFAEGSRRVVVERGGSDDRIVVVSGSDVPERIERPRRESGSPCRFVYLGSIGPMYGLDMVVDAWGAMQERGNRCSLTFIGDGPDRQRLQERAERLGLDNVTFRPPVPKDQIFNALAQFDVGILSFLPGEQFTFGISPQKMFDYMAACLPIVSNVHGEIATLIEDAGAGVTAPEQTAEGLARTLDAVVRAGEETWAPREFGRTYLEHHANRRAMVATLVDRIERI